MKPKDKAALVAARVMPIPGRRAKRSTKPKQPQRKTFSVSSHEHIAMLDDVRPNDMILVRGDGARVAKLYRVEMVNPIELELMKGVDKFSTRYQQEVAQMEEMAKGVIGAPVKPEPPPKPVVYSKHIDNNAFAKAMRERRKMKK